MAEENKSHANARTVAFNTIMLYTRMALMMVVGFFTARVNLDSLGVDNYGIYNVVGGLVVMFTIISGSLTTAISRFITYELGTGDNKRMQLIFSSSLLILIALSLLLALLAESVGLWFVNTYMNIPLNRVVAANWVYQLSIISFITSLLSTPYNATIIAHEKMSAFAYISVVEALLKLLIAYLTFISPIDKLIFFACANCLVSILIRNIYTAYCHKHFGECHFTMEFDRPLLKKMFSFAGWNFFGAGSLQLMIQGVNVLINMFFGVTVNAARGLTTTLENTIMGFVNNFTMAINPQITKSYAANEKPYMFQLIYKGAKFSFFLMMFFAIPCILEAETLLGMWLKEVPEYTAIFLRLALVASMISVLSNTMMTAMLATGDIKKYQIIVGGLGMVVFPVTWTAYALGASPQVTYLVIIFVYILQFCVRLYLLREMIGLSTKEYLSQVLVRALLVATITYAPSYLLYKILDNSITSFLTVCASCILISITSVYILGLDKIERNYIKTIITNRLHRS